MWTRAFAGMLSVFVGVVWIAQGTNVLRGSGMSGHGVWALIGVVALVLGVALLVWAWRIRSRIPD